jgi:hypothetical protein
MRRSRAVANKLKTKIELALHILEAKRPWTDQRRQDCVATVLSLFVGSDLFGTSQKSWRLSTAGFKGFDNNLHRVDAKLFQNLYSSCPKSLKFALASTASFLRLDPETFKTLFYDVYRRHASGFPHRRALASTLNAYLISFHPEAAHEYEDIILECLRSPKPELRMRGLYMAGFLDDLEMKDLELMKKKIYARSNLRDCAINGLCELLKRRKRVSPRVLAFCLDPKIRAKAERIYGWGPDDGNRLSAYYLLKAIREARNDARTLRKLKAAGYPLP